jgi:hypothetical protein
VDRYGRENATKVDAVYVRIVPGVQSTRLKVLFDEAQGTAVVLQAFATAEDMEAGARVFSAMDPSDTPGTRASVDMCELKLERTAT